MSKVKNHLTKLTKLHKSEAFKKSRFSRANLVVFAIIFASIGGYLIYSSFAASGTGVAAETENGTLAGNASVVNDTNVSGAKAVKFGNTPAQTLNCMPNPSACGYPDLDGPDQVGVTPGITLTPVNSFVTLSTDGQIYENKLVTGQIRVTARNVIIRNVKLIATDNYYGILSQGQNLTVEHTEITRTSGGRGTPPVLGDGSGGDFYGIGTQNYSARWVYVHNLSDCFGLSGVNVAINITIQDSLCAVGVDSNNNGFPDGGTYDGGQQHQSNGTFPPSPATPSYCYSGGGSAQEHFDGLQSDGGTNITLIHNTVRNACSETSAINMSSNTASVSNVNISNNLIAGGGFTLYCGGINDPNSVTNETVSNNRISNAYWSNGGYYGPLAYCGAGFADTFSGNVWDETGASITP
jgi:hypothetical protein